MQRFWKSVIRPVLSEIDPRILIEIGQDHGGNTRNLLEFCRETGAVLHGVDPLPKFPVLEWAQEFSPLFVQHRKLSHAALPEIESADAVLIDGDHNWHTVHGELTILDDVAREAGRPFPVVFIHDVDWPYARRDLYYNPSNIPENARHPYEQRAIDPETDTLTSSLGLNPHLLHAQHAGGGHNGVLTAVEDFVKGSSRDLHLARVSGRGGFGVLFERSRAEASPTLGAYLQSFPDYMEEHGHYALLERERIASHVSEKRSRTAEHDRRSEARFLSQQLQRERDAVRHLTHSLESLQGLFLEIRYGAEWLLRTKRWKIGRRIGDAIQTLRRRAPEPGADAHLLDSLTRYDTRSQQATVQLKELRHSAAVASRPAVSRNTIADVVICVHNALEDVERCLASVAKHTDSRHRIILVDDGSSPDCAQRLREWQAQMANAELLRSEDAQGYTRAANRGLAAATGHWTVLLNSDTIVGPEWLEGLLECGESHPSFGIVGPLSNAASWQSIPDLHDGNGDWAVNEIPDGSSLDDVALSIRNQGRRAFARVPLVNGFCFAIRRKVLDAIGAFDEEGFPRGYGEENDFCFRAADAGFQLAIADHVYVYHAKSKSFTHEGRRKLAKAGGQVLQDKHGADRVKTAVQFMKDSPDLLEARELATRLLSAPPSRSVSRPRILFLLPVRAGGGGAHSVVQEANGMRRMGTTARVAVERKHQDAFLAMYAGRENFADSFLFYDSEDELISECVEFDVVIATANHTIDLLQRILLRHDVIPAYYIQDYEPLFYQEGTQGWRVAHDSYSAIPNCVAFAKTDWIREQVRDAHGVHVNKVHPSLDTSVFYPPAGIADAGRPLRICAMVRPITPRRGAHRTMEVLAEVARKHGSQVEIHIFGTTQKDIDAHELRHDFPFTNHGFLSHGAVADLLRASDIFLDLSDYQAFGRTGIEAMACGCATVLPVDGGTGEYARHENNSLLVDTSSPPACLEAVMELVENHNLRHQIIANGIERAFEFSIARAAASELELLRREYRQRSSSGPAIETRERGGRSQQ